MSRIPLISVAEMTEEQKAQYDKFPSNLTRGLLLLDSRLAVALPNLANALRASSLDAKIREAVILRVAALHRSAYERMQHLGQAQKAGWTDTEIAALEAGGEAVRDPVLKKVLAFVDACVSGPDVPDQIFTDAGNVLTHRDVATVIILVGHYMMVARFLGILQVELDAHPDSWQGEH